jgi:hypothetical protein
MKVALSMFSNINIDSAIMYRKLYKISEDSTIIL